MKKLILIGGGNLASKENKRIHQYMLECSKKALPSVLYIPTASNYSENNINNFIKCMNDFSCTVKIFNDKNDLNFADVIYIGGGNTEHMIQEFKNKGILEELIKHLDDKIMVGISAGAIFWFKMYYSDVFAFDMGNGITNYRLLNGINYFDGYCCPHYDHENIESFNSYVNNEFAVALEDNTAIILDDDGLDFVKENNKKAIYYFDFGTLKVLTNEIKNELFALFQKSMKKREMK